ncbi:FecR family protein [Parapedobacter koreensis]|uniref:FecR family protein n=1 Tax=Parapedobacter koreensis TaxID=332977 RepID=A0A1H7FRZ2_9SPHI|nr:FecR domain-containing protein [Parapedobacter koreensis]SEK28738.1 FecR family protein [Parapedobacter koreensis]
MDNIRKAIAAFWQGKTTKEEQQQLLSDLTTRQSELKSDLAKEFVGDKADERMALSKERTAELLHRIHERLEHPEQPVPMRWWKTKWTAAAAVILLSSISWYVLDITGRTKEHATTYAAVIPHKLSNAGEDTLHFRMPDGSIITLSPRSTVSYTTEYGVTNRELILEGEAKFTVVRDTTRPFIVSANGYTTTALGTAFIVNARQERKTLVRLITGKVVVRSTAASLFAMEDTFLLPGDEVQISGVDGAIAVKRKPKVPRTLRAPVKQPKPTALRDTTVFLQFEQTPLATVFDRIASQLKTRIAVVGANLDGLSFTGSFEATDSLDVILSVICQMNDLTHEYQTDQVVIRKKEEETQ